MTEKEIIDRLDLKVVIFPQQFVFGAFVRFEDAEQAVKDAYKNGKHDEFVKNMEESRRNNTDSDYDQ